MTVTGDHRDAPASARRRREHPAPVARSVVRRDVEGNELGRVELAPDIFGIIPNSAVVHQVVTAQQAAARAGTHSSKTRAEVRGGGSKPYRQKGTGRSRQGSIRSPQWVGGGIVAGPKPRSYRQHTPKKMVRLALRSALSDRAAEERIVLVDRFGWESPRTKDALSAMSALGVDRRVLVVLSDDDDTAERSFGNIPWVHTVPVRELTAFAVTRSDWVVFTDATLPGSTPAAADSADDTDIESESGTGIDADTESGTGDTEIEGDDG